MDSVFLRALKRHPDKAPQWFVGLFAATNAAQMSRFMNDQPRWRDALAVASALPPASRIAMVINDTTNTDNVLYRSSGGRRYQFVILIIASLALIVGVMLPGLSIEQQFWIVLLPIGVFGLSHGGADPMILKKLTATSPTGLFVVLCVYLMASLAFIALIWVLPVVAQLVFLGLSVWHFGYTDEAFLSSAKNPLLRWLSGSMPILGPMLGHQPGKQASCLPG